MKRLCAVPATVALGLALAGPAAAGNSNTIYVIQESSLGGSGNTLTVDQSAANNSLVRGLNEGEAAKQKGDGNEAILTIEGTGGVIELLQDNSASGLPGNRARVEVNGNALGTVSQIGSNNRAVLSVSGELAQGTIIQNGDLNTANLTVAGSDANGSITQTGGQTETQLNVLGAGTSVNYTVNGNGVSNVQAGGLQVFTNGATVTITQTAVVPISR